MKLQETERSAAVAWSPLSQFPAYLATGTVAGSLDVDFDTSAHLEIFAIDFSNNAKLTVVGKASAGDRFNKLCWGLTGVQNGTYPKGLLAGGLNNGIINVWNPSKIIGSLEENYASEEDNPLIVTCEKHGNGPVQGLDFNPYQHNLLASGGSDSEIFIWDLQNTKAPTVYNPGAKTQVYQDSGITCVQWNRKVQHILASVNYSGSTSVWDLKAKRAVLSFNSPNRKLRCKALAWNPDEATQVVTASEDDSAPVIELWDLRNTYSPTKVLEGHTRGIWALSWCPMDSDLLLSCAKDNRTLCWNVKTGEIQSEVEVNAQTWNFDVQWSPRIPAILSTCSLERKVSIYSLQDVRNSSGDKSLGIVPQQKVQSHPPKWLKRPIGVTWGFGGKIVSFKKPKPGEKGKVFINQVVTDRDFLARADRLEEAIAHNDLKKFCEEKIASAANEDEKSSWSLMRLLFEQSRTQLLQFLGFSSDKISQEIKEYISKLTPTEEKEKPPKEEEKKAQPEPEPTSDGQNKDVSGLFSGEGTEESVFASISQAPAPAPVQKPAVVQKDTSPVQYVTDGPEGMVTQALIVGNFEAAVDCCINSGRMADALVLAAYGGPELWKKTQEAYFNQKSKPFMKVVSSIIRDELRELVERSDLSQWETTLAVICTYAKREEFAILSGLLGDRLLLQAKDEKSATQCYICAGNIDKLLQLWVKETSETHKPYQALQNLIEKVSVFRKAVSHNEPLGEKVAEKFSEYAQLLASQGRLQNASHCLSFLLEAKHEDTTTAPFVLLYRLYNAQKNPGFAPPPFPFQRVDVSANVVKPQQPVSHQHPPATTAYPQRATVPPPTGNVGVAPTMQAYGVSSSSYHPPSVIPPTAVSHTPPMRTPPPMSMPTSHVTPPNPIHVMTPPPLNVMNPVPSTTVPPTTMVPPPTTVAPPPLNVRPVVPPSSIPVSTPVAPPVTPPPVHTVAPPTTIAPPPMATNLPQSKPVDKAQLPTANTHLINKQQSASSGGGPTSSENQYVIDALNNIITQCSNSPDPKTKKYAADVSKRMEPLIEKLSKNEFTTGVTQNLTQLVQAIMAGDSRTALNIQQEMTQKHWEELGSNFMIALKRLIEMTKS